MNILLLTENDQLYNILRSDSSNNFQVFWYNDDSKIEFDTIPDVIIANHNVIKNSEILKNFLKNIYLPVIILVDEANNINEVLFENVTPYQILKYPIDFNVLKLNILTAYFNSKEFLKLKKQKKDLEVSLNKVIEKSLDINFYENQILKSKYLYYSSLNALNEAIFVVDEDLNIILENNAWKELKKRVNLEEITLGETIDILAKKLRGFKLSEYILALKLGDEFIEKDVEIVPGLFCEIQKSPIKDEDGYVSRVITVIKDITEYHKAQELIKKSEKKFRELMEFLPEMIIETDSKGRITYMNKFAMNKLDITEEDLAKGFSAFDVFVEEDKERAYKNFLRRINERIKGIEEYTLKNKYNELLNVIVYTNPIIEGNKIRGVRSVVVDITARKKFENQLKEALETTQKIIDNVPFGVVIVDKNKKITKTNTAALKILHKKAYQLVGKECFLCTEERNFSCPIITKKPISNSEIKIKDAQNNTKYIIASSIPIKIQNDDYILEAFADITALKEYENYIKQQSDLLALSLKYEEILAEISIVLNSLEELNIKINKALNILGLGLNVSRVYIFKDSYDKKFTSNIYEWCSTNIESYISKLQNIPYEEIIEIRDLLETHKLVVIDNINKLSSRNLIEHLSQQNIKSLMLYPIKFSEFETGFIGINECLKFREWNKFEQELIITAAHLISNVFIRKNYEDNIINREETTRALINAIPDYLFHTDFNGNIILFNPAKNDKYHFISTELFHSTNNFIDLFPFSVKHKIIKGLNQCKINGYSDVDIEIQYNNKNLYYEARFEKVNNQECIILLRNVTDEKEYQQQLKISKKIAEEEKLKAETANKAKSEFLANMSHEIRTPLNAIIGYTEFLLSKSINPSEKKVLETIMNSANVLLSLINDILDLSKIEANKLELKPEPVNLRSIVKEIKQIFLQKAEEKELKLLIDYNEDIPETMILDEIRIRQILLNLVGNAIKFTHEGYVKIGVDGNRNIDNTIDLKIYVEDTGIGINESQKESIFEAFKQDSNLNTKKYGGTGLGLAICKRLVEKMNGEISVYSQVGKGSVFIVRIPGVKIDETMTLTEDSETNIQDIVKVNFFPSKVLIVDDVKSNIEVIKNLLENQPIEFFEAENGEQAINILKNNIIPDLIIMDIRMPQMDGIQTTKIIRKELKLEKIPIVAYTASTLEFNNRLTKKLFDGYILKPAKKINLVNELTKFLKYQLDEKFDTVSKDNKSDLYKIKVNWINNDIVNKWNNIKNSNMIDDIEEFFKEFKNLATINKNDGLISFIDELLNSIQIFDIKQMKILMNKFDEFLKVNYHGNE